jgi:hypothetical protein
MDLEKAKALIESRAVQKYIQAIDEDAETALSEHKANLGEMDDYPDKYLSEYKSDAKKLDNAWGDFNSEWNKIAFKRAKDGKAAIAAYKNYVLRLGVLEEQNVRFSAFIESDAANQAAWFITVMIAALERAKEAARNLQKEAQDLEKLLRQAKNDVTGAEIQRAVGVALTALAILLPPLGATATITIGVATLTASLVIDAALGPGNPSLPGVAVQTTSTIAGMPKVMSNAGGKLAGGLAGIYSLKSDSDEIEDAKKIVKAIQEKARKVEDLLKTFIKFLEVDADKVEEMKKATERALRDGIAAAGKYKSAESRRLALLKELGDLK